MNHEIIAVDDNELAKVLGVSVSFLRKDRQTKQLIPYYKLGGRVLYNLDRVREALAQYEQGGDAAKRKAGRKAGAR